MNTVISIRHVSKVYSRGVNALKALDDVTLQVNDGEFVAIIGQSGSGKSTLMNIIGCLDAPTSGEYTLNGETVAELSDRRLSDIRNRSIGFIFQGFNLIPAMSAIENVELPLIYRGMKREQRRRLATDALQKVGLETRMHHRPGEMSGGQQQRVAIARAIASSPPVILADEPTGNLDSKSGSEVIDILRGLHHEKRTIVLITHDNSIAQAAERMITIMDGKIIQDQVKGMA